MAKTLSIKGNNYAFTFGIGFLGEFLEQTGYEFEEALSKTDKNPFKMIPLLMYHSAKYNAELEDNPCDITLKDVIEALEEGGGIGHPTSIWFIESFTKYLKKGVPKEEETEEPKKKLIGQKM